MTELPDENRRKLIDLEPTSRITLILPGHEALALSRLWCSFGEAYDRGRKVI